MAPCTEGPAWKRGQVGLTGPSAPRCIDHGGIAKIPRQPSAAEFPNSPEDPRVGAGPQLPHDHSPWPCGRAAGSPSIDDPVAPAPNGRDRTQRSLRQVVPGPLRAHAPPEDRPGQDRAAHSRGAETRFDRKDDCGGSSGECSERSCPCPAAPTIARPVPGRTGARAEGRGAGAWRRTRRTPQPDARISPSARRHRIPARRERSPSCCRSGRFDGGYGHGQPGPAPRPPRRARAKRSPPGSGHG